MGEESNMKTAKNHSMKYQPQDIRLSGGIVRGDLFEVIYKETKDMSLSGLLTLKISKLIGYENKEMEESFDRTLAHIEAEEEERIIQSNGSK